MRNWSNQTVVAALLLLAPLNTWARYTPHPCKNAFSEQQETTEGQKAAQEVYKQMPVLPDSDPVSRYVQQLGARLVEHAPGYKWPSTSQVGNMEDFKASPLPGGPFFVNRGTIRQQRQRRSLP